MLTGIKLGADELDAHRPVTEIIPLVRNYAPDPSLVQVSKHSPRFRLHLHQGPYVCHSLGLAQHRLLSAQLGHIASDTAATAAAIAPRRPSTAPASRGGRQGVLPCNTVRESQQARSGGGGGGEGGGMGEG